LVAEDAEKGIDYFGLGWTDSSTLRRYYLTLSEKKVKTYREKASAIF
jgi:hypothetical protein